MNDDYYHAMAGHLEFIEKMHERSMGKLEAAIDRQLICPHCKKVVKAVLPDDADLSTSIRLVRSRD